MSQTIHFYAGLPRSGGTVLASILSQNPDVFVTNNTALYDVLEAANRAWHAAPTVIGHPIPEQLSNINKGITESAWAHVSKPIIIDRDRSWAKSMPISSLWFEKDIKAITSIRNIPGIMASWVTLVKSEKGVDSQAAVDRIVEDVWINFTKDFLTTFVQMKQEADDRVFFFDYDDIVSNPRFYLSEIENFLGLPKFEYDLENIEGDFQDQNIVPGGFKGMHAVRPKYAKTSLPPQEVLGLELYKKYQEIDDEFRTNLGLQVRSKLDPVIIR